MNKINNLRTIIESLIFWICITTPLIILYHSSYFITSILVNVNETENSPILLFFVEHSTTLKCCVPMISYMIYIIWVRVLVKIRMLYRNRKNISFSTVLFKAEMYFALFALLFYTLYMSGTNAGFDPDFSGYVLVMIIGFLFGENIIFAGIRKSSSEIFSRINSLFMAIQANIFEFLPSFLVNILYIAITILNIQYPCWPFKFIFGTFILVLFLLVCAMVKFFVTLVPNHFGR